MFEMLNSAACFLMLLYSLPVAMVMDNRGQWLKRLSIVVVMFGLFLQATNPWARWVGEILWPSCLLHTAMAVMLSVWWQRAWIFVRSYLAPIDGDLDHMRRAEDWGEAPPRQTAGFPDTWVGRPKH